MGKPATMNGASARIAGKCRKKTRGAMTRGSSCLAKLPPRPRVVITEVADFRRLVQDLTGNRSPSPCTSSSPTPSTDSDTVSRRSDGGHVLYDFEEVTGREGNASDCFSGDPSLYYPQPVSVYEQQTLSLGEVESWLLESDSAVPYYESYSQEISIFDYVMGDLYEGQKKVA
ncbi:hypothetical protein MLD38_025907 [Melastoma candidum]|uniref:Uncharacterized protein n=1 Tax=Melastoma candidum TaxID=119954 RepID=A0ACB9NY93_9MYRT|nr:hypothetical protein MLD38_025907 [Melastoma candidum]